MNVGSRTGAAHAIGNLLLRRVRLLDGGAEFVAEDQDREVAGLGQVIGAQRYDRVADDVERVTGRTALSVREFVSLRANEFGGRRL